MPLHSSLPRPTEAQLRRWGAIRECGCILCRKIGLGYVPPEIHHLTDTGRRISHDHTIGLCEYHHQGRTAYRKEQALHIYGPSLAHGAKPFRAHWGTNPELLELQEKLLKCL
jgi:hypothetical protein